MDHSLGYDGFRDFTWLICSAHSISKWAPRVDWHPHRENPWRWQQGKEEVCAAFLRNTAWPQPLGPPKGASMSQNFPLCPLEPRTAVPGAWCRGNGGGGGSCLKASSCHGDGEPIRRAHPQGPPRATPSSLPQHPVSSALTPPSELGVISQEMTVGVSHVGSHP